MGMHFHFSTRLKLVLEVWRKNSQAMVQRVGSKAHIMVYEYVFQVFSHNLSHIQVKFVSLRSDGHHAILQNVILKVPRVAEPWIEILVSQTCALKKIFERPKFQSR